MDIDNSDIRAAQEDQEFCNTGQAVLDKVQLQHPLAYDNLNLFDMQKKGSMKILSIAMLKTACEYFGVFHRRIPGKAQGGVSFCFRGACHGVWQLCCV